MKRAAIGAGIVAALAGLVLLARAQPVREVAWRALEGAPEQTKEYPKWAGLEVKPTGRAAKAVATVKTNIDSGSYSGGGTFVVRVYPNSDAVIVDMRATAGTVYPLFQVVLASGAPEGYLRVQLTVRYSDAPEYMLEDSKTVDVAIPGSGYTEARWDFSWTAAGCPLTCTHSTNPIGDKGATHAKENVISESWDYSSPQTISATFDTLSISGPCDPTIPTPLSMFIGPCSVEPHAWNNLTIPAVAYEDLNFCGETVDLSGYAAEIWGGEDEGEHALWARGTADGDIQIWGDTVGYSTVYTWTGGTIAAPFSYNFSNLVCKWMDGTDVDSALQVYCTGLRNLNESGVDIGDWHGTFAALKALGTVKQKYGFHSWDTWDADMQAVVELYLDLTSAEALGIEIRGPQPAFKVEGAGFGVTVVGEEVTPSPYDGQYAAYGPHNGETSYTNGTGYLYCVDAEAGTCGLGPGPPADPYYLQEGGGPAGNYLVNTASYDDDVIDEETGQRRFSGFLGEGVGPAVSADTSEAISVDSDCASPSFQHDATFIFDCWPLDAVSRSVSPYMTDVSSLAADTSKGIYADAHDHTDWVGVNCTTPDAGGNCTVSAGGGSLTLTLKCNYRDRQAAVPGQANISAPTAYRYRRHDSQLGEGTPAETAEAVWDWRGRYLTQAVKLPSVPVDVTCTITYYCDLDGVGDNHKTDSTRQTDYSYSAGDLHTLTRTIPVSYVYPVDYETEALRGFSPILIDLYDEQNNLPVAMAVTLKWEFSEAGAYQLSAPTLTADAGDRQEVTTTDPYYREAPAGDGFALKVGESWRYAQGVVSAHYNGLCDRVLYMQDNVKGCVVEKCFPTLDVLIGAKTGEDLTAPYTLAGWPITNSGDAWTYTHTQANEDVHMVDADSARLKTLSCTDLMPQMTVSTLTAAVRCYQITCVNGLPYVFQGAKYVGGRAHGMTVHSDKPDDFPRCRSGNAAKLLRRHLGSEDGWQGAGGPYATDQHGHWESTAQAITDTNAARELWEYAIPVDGVTTSIGRFATREWVLREALYPTQEDTHWCHDAAGYEWQVIESAGKVRVQFRDLLDINTAVDSPWTDGAHKQPSIVVMDDGALVVFATNTGTGNIDIRRSRKGGEDWEDVVTAFGTGLKYGRAFYRGSHTYLPAYSASAAKVYLCATTHHEMAREVLDGTNTLLQVCDYTLDLDDLPQIHGFVQDDGAVIVSVGDTNGTCFYRCRNWRSGFSEVA